MLHFRYMPSNYQRKTNRPYTKRGTDVHVRFWSYVPSRPKTGCWLWRGCVSWDNGYGRFKMETGQTMSAQRASYHLAHMVDLTPDVHVCHRCDNPLCVRPDHLFLGTALINMLDRKIKGRHRLRTNTKLTLAQYEEIRRRRKKGERAKDLAAKFGVNRRTISKVCRIIPTSERPSPASP